MFKPPSENFCENFDCYIIKKYFAIDFFFANDRFVV